MTTSAVRAAGTSALPPVEWKLRIAAAQRGVWTGAQLRRLLAERAGLRLSAASVSVLLTKQPSRVKLSTLAALCAALDCTPGDLLSLRESSSPPQCTAVNADPPAQPAPVPGRRSLPPL